MKTNQFKIKTRIIVRFKKPTENIIKWSTEPTTNMTSTTSINTTSGIFNK